MEKRAKKTGLKYEVRDHHRFPALKFEVLEEQGLLFSAQAFAEAPQFARSSRAAWRTSRARTWAGTTSQQQTSTRRLTSAA